jgi:hypothetical protein
VKERRNRRRKNLKKSLIILVFAKVPNLHNFLSPYPIYFMHTYSHRKEFLYNVAHTKVVNPLPKQPLPQANTFPPFLENLCVKEEEDEEGCVLDLSEVFGALKEGLTRKLKMRNGSSSKVP